MRRDFCKDRYQQQGLRALLLFACANADLDVAAVKTGMDLWDLDMAEVKTGMDLDDLRLAAVKTGIIIYSNHIFY